MTVPAAPPAVEPFDAVDVIAAKRDRQPLTDPQIAWVVDAYTRGVVADEQMAALAMAVLLNGLDRRETSTWTAAMIASGERLDFTDLVRDGALLPTADKHSTGGVGDKTTLPLAPLVAAHGVAVPQLSGRGLGHTGGTLDKLEAIPGWRADLTTAQVRAQLRDVGAVEVDLDGTPGYVLPDDLDPEPACDRWCALLPGLDVTTMGWQHRDWYLGPHRAHVFDRNGNGGPTAWCDGRIVGGWTQDPDGRVVDPLAVGDRGGGDVDPPPQQRQGPTEAHRHAHLRGPDHRLDPGPGGRRDGRRRPPPLTGRKR